MKKLKVVSFILLIVMIILNITCISVFASSADDPISNPDYWVPNTNTDTSVLSDKIGGILGIIQVIGIITSVVVLMILGIKYMLGSAEEKAADKKAMIPYLVGAVLVFSVTTIPNFVYNITNSMFSGAHEHHYIATIVQEKTCTLSEVTEYRCGCGSWYHEQTQLPGHDIQEGGFWHASCESVGIYNYYCTRCAWEDVKEIPATGHKYEEVVYEKRPTCEYGGQIVKVCTNTSNGIKCTSSVTENLDPLGHDWDEGKLTKEPTCTSKGTWTYTCKTCGQEKNENQVAALGHDYEKTTIKEGTCKEKGKVRYTCKTCGDSFTEEKYGNHVFPAGSSFDENGEFNTCSICGTKQYK